MCVGFGSLWMMSEQKLMRVALADNTVTEIPIDGARGRMAPDCCRGGRRLGSG